jgi:hypothetical protein
MVVYAQVDDSFAVWDPARNHWKDTEQNPDATERPSAFLFKADEIWNGLQEGSKRLCNGLILDWAAWQRENGDAFGQLRNVLRALSPSPKEPLKEGRLTRVALNDTRDHPTLTTPYDQEVPIVHCSAGIRRIVALAYLLVWTWQEHMRACEIRGMKPAREIVFLIDEIEAHLHPQWQRRIVNALLDVMKALAGTVVIRKGPGAVSVQLIATTHSPLVLASAEPIFDPEKDAWFDLDLSRTNSVDRVHLQERTFVRHGDVSNWLTSEAFDLKEPRSIEAEEAISKALALAKTPSPSKKEIAKVDLLLRHALSDVDRFWLRWSEFRTRSESKR